MAIQAVHPVQKMDISVVVPLFNEAESLPELTDWIRRVMKANGFTYEIILVDDGSNDGSWEVIEALYEQNPYIRGIKFRRNYGKSAALNVGFEATRGEVVIRMPICRIRRRKFRNCTARSGRKNLIWFPVGKQNVTIRSAKLFQPNCLTPQRAACRAYITCTILIAA